jgi:hypothetical protein
MKDPLEIFIGELFSFLENELVKADNYTLYDK